MSRAFINESTLTAIGDAIRAKTGKSDLIAPGDMPTEIENIPTGGGDLPEEAFVVTGNCSYRFANNGWTWFIHEFGNRVTTHNIGDGSSMFANSQMTKIPFDLNFASSNNYSYGGLCSGCMYLEEIGALNNMYPMSINGLFENCYKLRKVPEFNNFNASKLQTYAYANVGGIFRACSSLREIKLDTLKMFMAPLVTSSYSHLYYQTFAYCYALDEIAIPVAQQTFTSNMFTATLDKCGRAKEFVFETNADGSPIAVNWKGQTLFANELGWLPTSSDVSNFKNRTGFTTDTRVFDAATYEALKDTPDWWTDVYQYSRYNHDSAVNTINSLPDCSASGGVNTIRFLGRSGELTDGGAINTLTEEEIAVAAAKGWTVTLA